MASVRQVVKAPSGARRKKEASQSALARCIAGSFSQGDQLVATASIGIAIATDPEAPSETLLDGAKLAMGAVAAAGGNRWSFYSPTERGSKP